MNVLRFSEIWAILFAIILITGCKTKYDLVISTDIITESPSVEILMSLKDLEQSVDVPLTTKTIRTYFHFFDNIEGNLNYHQNDAPKIVAQLLNFANQRLLENQKMNLPKGNNLPVKNTHLKYELADYQGAPGIFHHFHDQPEYFIKNGQKSNRYDRKMIREYAVNADSVINVLVSPFDPQQLLSGEQRVERTAIALGTSIKLPGLFQSEKPIWEYAGIFNHEVGHVFGLRHSWDNNDGCSDTPLNDNCWNTSEDPPCNGITSNNLMDYNAFQSAITPCQIARMQANIANPGHIASRLVKKNWCKESESDYVLETVQKWSQPVIYPGNLEIRKGGVLYVSSLIVMPKGSYIKINKGGILILENATLYNSCGDLWQGILRHPKGMLYLVGSNNSIKDVTGSLASYHRN